MSGFLTQIWDFAKKKVSPDGCGSGNMFLKTRALSNIIRELGSVGRTFKDVASEVTDFRIKADGGNDRIVANCHTMFSIVKKTTILDTHEDVDVSQLLCEFLKFIVRD